MNQETLSSALAVGATKASHFRWRRLHQAEVKKRSSLKSSATINAIEVKSEGSAKRGQRLHIKHFLREARPLGILSS